MHVQNKSKFAYNRISAHYKSTGKHVFADPKPVLTHYCYMCRCCQGRIVSALEGGYRLHGENVSAFARSVAAHVSRLMENTTQKWDEAEAQVFLCCMWPLK